MPVQDIVLLSVIVGAFVSFGVILGAVTWYCSDQRKRPTGSHHRHYGFSSQAGLITDDD